MSAQDPVIGTYNIMNNHLSMHDIPQTQLSSETSSTSSELESALSNAVKTPPGILENGPDGYPSDGSSSVENQNPMPVSYINGPVQLAAPGGYTEYVDGHMTDGNGLDYAAPAPEYDGQQAVGDYTQDYPSPEQIYPGVATSGQDYQTNAVGVPTQVGDYQGMGVGVGEEISPQGQVQDTGQNSGQANKKYVFYLQIKQGEAFPVGNGDQVQYIHGEYISWYCHLKLFENNTENPHYGVLLYVLCVCFVNINKRRSSTIYKT